MDSDEVGMIDEETSDRNDELPMDEETKRGKLLELVETVKNVAGEKSLGCEHYKRKCQLVCPEKSCDKVYTCRICHDESESHVLDRYKVQEVVCLVCSKRQPKSSNCINCSTLFGKYHCSICNLYMDEDKSTFHCADCGLCRVGPAEHFFHCQKCEMCMPIYLKDGNHKCIEKASRRDCPLCLEDIHTSRINSHIPKCGHLIHQACYNEMIKKAMYQCPVCNASMIDMTSVWAYLDEKIKTSPPLPPEYANRDVYILCRDCHKFTTVVFHFIGLKCGECGGYNTTVERGPVLNLDMVREVLQSNIQAIENLEENDDEIDEFENLEENDEEDEDIENLDENEEIENDNDGEIEEEEDIENENEIMSGEETLIISPSSITHEQSHNNTTNSFTHNTNEQNEERRDSMGFDQN